MKTLKLKTFKLEKPSQKPAITYQGPTLGMFAVLASQLPVAKPVAVNIAGTPVK